MMLGTHFVLSELTRSEAATRLGLDNTPDDRQVGNLRELVRWVLDPLRAALGRPIVVTSGYRSSAVNAAVNGSRTSDHMVGFAADIKCNGLSATELMGAAVRLGLPYDQLIGYAPQRGGHVHVSYQPTARRGQVLWAPPTGRMVPWRP